jgi:hypothetical protein
MGAIPKAKLLEEILEYNPGKNLLAKKYGTTVRVVEEVQKVANQITEAHLEKCKNDMRLAEVIYENAHVCNTLKARVMELLMVDPNSLQFGMSSAAQIWESAARIFKVAYTAELELTGRDASARAATAIENMSDLALAKELRELERLIPTNDKLSSAIEEGTG